MADAKQEREPKMRVVPIRFKPEDWALICEVAGELPPSRYIRERALAAARRGRR